MRLLKLLSSVIRVGSLVEQLSVLDSWCWVSGVGRCGGCRVGDITRQAVNRALGIAYTQHCALPQGQTILVNIQIVIHYQHKNIQAFSKIKAIWRKTFKKNLRRSTSKCHLWNRTKSRTSEDGGKVESPAACFAIIIQSCPKCMFYFML